MVNTVIHGDCLEVLKSLPDNSVDAIVTDPPAGIAFMGKDWDKDKGGRTQWIDWMSQIASECLRVIKPGGHALVWALPRTSHWTAFAWEDGGWKLRDTVIHIFGSGLPKGLDISKAIDREAGEEREVVGYKRRGSRSMFDHGKPRLATLPVTLPVTLPATLPAKEWEGWGTALKPAYENWHLFRKPIAEKTIAANVLEHGTGGLNINGARVGTDEIKTQAKAKGASFTTGFNGCAESTHYGRFPANVTHDGSDEVMAIFPDVKSGGGDKHSKTQKGNTFSGINPLSGVRQYEPSEGSAARFFYCAKASTRDRDEGLDGFNEKTRNTYNDFDGTLEHSPKQNILSKNHHPTVKNTELMRYLCRLITPPNGLILDPFCGSGSTGKGAVLEGFDFIGIEQDAEYCEIARARIAYVSEPKQPTLEERVKWLETQGQAQGKQIKAIQKTQQLNLFA